VESGRINSLPERQSEWCVILWIRSQYHSILGAEKREHRITKRPARAITSQRSFWVSPNFLQHFGSTIIFTVTRLTLNRLSQVLDLVWLALHDFRHRAF
jgi:hypothetical protein